MLSHPRLKANLKATALEPGVLFLMGEHQELVFEGGAFVALAELLDGRRSVGEVLAEAAKRVPWPVAYAALAQLERKGCLTEGEALETPDAAAYWDALGCPASRVREALETHAVSLEALGGLPVEPLRRALAQAGLRASGQGLRVVATPDYLLPELGERNRLALEERSPWLVFKPAGNVLWIGPLFRPGETGCWQCLAARLRVNRQVEHDAGRRSGRTQPLGVAKGWLASSLAFGAALAAGELARALVEDGEARLAGRVLTFDLVRRELAEHVLVRRPQCPACGEPALGRRAGPVVLEPRPRPVATGEPERALAAQQTYERFAHHVSAVTGVVTSLVSREPGDHGLTHSFVAGHYFPVTSDDLSALRINLVARSGGKGRSELQAKTSALCEALERYSGIAWGDEPRRVASAGELGKDAVPLGELLQWSDAQYAERDSFNRTNVSTYHDVPPRLPAGARISWSPAWSLTRSRERLLPTAYCYYGFRDAEHFFTRCDSNGCAAGSSLEEAILYGFLELVERDAVALWWYNRVRRPAVDADSFELPRWRQLEHHYRAELGRELHALDLTSDLGIPVFAVVSRRLDRAVEDIILGFAAHLDPRLALSRALEEANQYLPSVREQAPDGSTVYRLYNEETQRWWKAATYANQPWLLPQDGPPRRAGELPTLLGDDVAEDVRSCVRAAERCGLELLVIDQTRPDVGLPVARVVVPGLRHFWRRLAPGRLYDVPVKLGWLARPLAEAELNPISCFV